MNKLLMIVLCIGALPLLASPPEIESEELTMKLQLGHIVPVYETRTRQYPVAIDNETLMATLVYTSTRDINEYFSPEKMIRLVLKPNPQKKGLVGQWIYDFSLKNGKSVVIIVDGHHQGDLVQLKFSVVAPDDARGNVLGTAETGYPLAYPTADATTHALRLPRFYLTKGQPLPCPPSVRERNGETKAEGKESFSYGLQPIVAIGDYDPATDEENPVSY